MSHFSACFLAWATNPVGSMELDLVPPFYSGKRRGRTMSIMIMDGFQVFLEPHLVTYLPVANIGTTPFPH